MHSCSTKVFGESTSLERQSPATADSKSTGCSQMVSQPQNQPCTIECAGDAITQIVPLPRDGC